MALGSLITVEEDFQRANCSYPSLIELELFRLHIFSENGTRALIKILLTSFGTPDSMLKPESEPIVESMATNWFDTEFQPPRNLQKQN
jgi:hypothetical protein